MPTPCPDRTRLKSLLDGTLSTADQIALSEHLESCRPCQQAIEELAAGRDTWVGAAQQLRQPPPEPDAALAQAMEQARQAGMTDDTTLGSDLLAELPLDFLSPPDEPGHLGKLDHYEVLEVVGRGAMGCVFRAFDQKLHRVVAIKAMSPQLATNAAARARFIREGQAAAAICHEHVVAVHAVEAARSLPFLVMHYVGGLSLQERIDRTGPLQVREILRIGMQAAYGLAAAHAQGLVHRDIKPANILLGERRRAGENHRLRSGRAVDDSSLTQTGVIAGSPQYMAPEQARGEVIDHRSDLFSLGSVLYALCTGRPPFRANTTLAVMKRVCEENPRPIREINSDIPNWLAAIVDKLLSKNPAERFQTAEEVGTLLGQHLAHLQQPDRIPRPATIVRPAEPVPAPHPTAAQGRWRGVRPAIVNSVAFVLLGGATLMWMMGQWRRGPLGASEAESYAGLLVATGSMYLIAVATIALFQRVRDRTWNGSLVGAHPFRVALAAGALFWLNCCLLDPHWRYPWLRLFGLVATTDISPMGERALLEIVNNEPSARWEVRTADGARTIALGDPVNANGRPSMTYEVGVGEYKVFAYVDGALWHAPRVNIARGQHAFVVIPQKSAGSSTAVPTPPGIEGLQLSVQLAENDLNRIRQLQKEAGVPESDVVQAEIQLKDANIRLAEGRRDSTRVMHLLEELVKLRETQLERVQQLATAGAASAADGAMARKLLNEDRIRLELARNRAGDDKRDPYE